MSDDGVKLDLFGTIKQIDLQNRNWYSQLSERHQKQAQPFLMMQWLSCGTNENQTIMINEVANPYMFKLYKHPQLLSKLLTVCTTGKSQRYKWIPSAKRTKITECLELVRKCYDVSSKEAKHILATISFDDLLMVMYSLGYQADEIKNIQKELKDMYD